MRKGVTGMNSLLCAVASYAVNSLWQAPLIAGGGWVMSRSMRKMGARTQHGMWVLTLWLMVLVPAMPLLLHAVPGFRVDGVGRGGASIAVAAAQDAAVSVKGVAVLPLWVVVAAVTIYSIALFYFVARLCWSMYWTMGLVRDARPLELVAESEALWRRCRGAFGLEEVWLLRSRRVDGPATLGFRRPVLLVPEGFAEGCEPHELLAALAHECAHVERKDFQKNVLYEVASLLIAFHPVTWMVKKQIAETREMVCDEIAVESVMDSQTYAKSLLRLAAMISVGSRAVPYNAIGIFDANILEKRIMTIRAKKQKVSARYGLIVPAALVLFSVSVGEAAARGVLVEANTQTVDAGSRYGKVYKIGSGVSAPIPIHTVDPEFTEAARKARVSGDTLLGLVVDKKGKPQGVHVVRSLRPDLDAKAIESVKQYRFKPAMKAGEPVAVALNIEVNFQIF
jgi:TonB family protein